MAHAIIDKDGKKLTQEKLKARAKEEDKIAAEKLAQAKAQSGKDK